MDDDLQAQEAQQHFTRLSYFETHYTCSKYLACVDILITIIIAIVARKEQAAWQLKVFCWALPARWLIKLPILKWRIDRFANYQPIHNLDFALNTLEVFCWTFCVWIFFFMLHRPELKAQSPYYHGFAIYQLSMFLFIICFPLAICLLCPILLLIFLPFVMLVYKCLPGPGATDSELDAIPCHVVGEGAAPHTREESCAICMCDYENGEEYRVLPCGHDFHKGCIDQWLKKKALCPLCRTWINQRRTQQNRVLGPLAPQQQENIPAIDEQI